jgi:ribosomal protein S27AE
MKTCSHCGQENDDAAMVCSECGAELAPPEIPQDPKRLEDPALALALVATFRNVVDAGMFRARLEAAGIEACVPEEYTPQIFWNVTPSPLEAVTVRVAAKDYEAAKTLLADYVDTSISASLCLAQEEGTEAGTDNVAPGKKDETFISGQAKCVACGAIIANTAQLCPKCGYTQPEMS